MLLAAAIISEVAGTLSLRASDGFTNLLPSIGVLVGYAGAFYALSLVLRELPLSVTYAIWSATGITLIAIIDTVVGDERLPMLRAVALALVVVGVVLLQTTGREPS